MSGVDIRWAGADDWSDLERLFGSGGASNGCWCQYWLLGAGYDQRDRSENRRDLEEEVGNGSAGLLAYRDDACVGWARLSPRAELTWLTSRFRRYDFGADAAEPWSLSCFYVARSARGQGVTRAVIEFAAAWGRDQHVPVEGYPIDQDADRPTRNVFSGILSTFLAAGFTERGRLAPDRAVVRS